MNQISLNISQKEMKLENLRNSLDENSWLSTIHFLNQINIYIQAKSYFLHA